MRRTAVPVCIAAVLCIFFATSGCGETPSSVESSTTPPSSTHIAVTSVAPAPPPSPQSTATLPPGEEPVEIVSWSFPPGHINPGGPYMELTIKNVWSAPVIYLVLILQGEGNTDNPTFPGNKVVVNFFKGLPLLPGKTYTQGYYLIGPLAPDFSLDNSYPVTINGTLEGGTAFIYTKEVSITLPAE